MVASRVIKTAALHRRRAFVRDIFLPVEGNSGMALVIIIYLCIFAQLLCLFKQRRLGQNQRLRQDLR